MANFNTSPRRLLVQKAVEEIANALSQSSSAYFFFIGAGVSAPQVPTAAGIVDQLNSHNALRGRTVPQEESGPSLAQYESAFQKKYPHALDRQKYLKGLIQNARISLASFRLAQILKSGRITKLLVTTNFDDMVEKALYFLSEYPLVCDSPGTIHRVDHAGSTDIQVVHVHGSYRYYDCINLRAEMSVQMNEFLDRILAERTPIVVGYSGWPDDTFMSALKKRLTFPLPHNLYWFAYSSIDIDKLPEWLRSHSSVRFVHLPEHLDFAQPKPRERPSDLVVSPASVASAQGKSKEPRRGPSLRLSANVVFDEIAHQLMIDVPEISRRPLEFFRDLLVNQLPEEDDEDLLGLKRAWLQVELAARIAASPDSATSAILHVLHAVGTPDGFSAALETARALDLKSIESEQLAEALDLALERIYLMDRYELAGLQLEACQLRWSLAQPRRSTTAAWQLRATKALYGQAFCHALLDDNINAISRYDQLVREFGSSSDRQIVLRVGRSWVGKGNLLEGKEAMSCYASALTCFDQLELDSELEADIATVLKCMAVAHSGAGERSLAIKAFENVIDRFKESANRDIRESVAASFAVLLDQLDDDIAAKLMDRMQTWFSNFGIGNDSGILFWLGYVHTQWGERLARAGKPAEAFEYHELARKHLLGMDRLEAKQILGWTLLRECDLLRSQDPQESSKKCQEIIDKYADSDDGTLKYLVEEATKRVKESSHD